MQTSLSRVVCILLLLTLVGVFCPPAHAQGGPALQSSVFLGGVGSQRGTAIVISGGAIYVSGNMQPETGSSTDMALLARYSVPPATSPVWIRNFGFGTLFGGIAASADGVYGAGANWSLSSDPAGGKEVKSILAKFALDGSNGAAPGGALWVRTQNFFVYGGVELHIAAKAAVEGSSTFVYATGGGQPCSFFGMIVAKYDNNSNLVASATDSSVGLSFGSCFVPSASGSDGKGIALLNGNVYVAGSSNWAFQDASPRPTIWKHGPGLNLLWRVKDTASAGMFAAITDFGGAIYAVGHTSTGANGLDYLITKYDESGTLLWRKVAGGSGDDELRGVVGLGGRIYAVGYTRSQGSGGADTVLLEIDPGNGDILSATLFGGAQDDFANGIATDGTDLYVVGESRSFASPQGNAIGQNDLVLLRYSPNANQAPEANAGADQTVECTSDTGTSVTLDGSGSSDPDDDTLTYTWRDAGNNVVGTDASIVVSLLLGLHTFTLTVDDGNGGVSSDSVSVTVQDTTAPTLTLASSSVTVVVPTGAATGEVVDVLTSSGANATDACDPNPALSHDGPAGGFFPIGETVVTITATDDSGNFSTAQFTVRLVYNFIGFLPPIHNDGSSIFKSGRVIPVKFQLTAADGSFVTNASATLAVFKVTDDVLGSVEVESAGDSNTDTAFRFDPATNQYIFNLSTKGYSTGSYLLRVLLNDGTQHEVMVSVK